MKVKAEFPEKMQSLFVPSRYKCYYGGRGGGKSHSVAKALVIMGAQKPLRILCTRELQRSITESVHKLLCDQIDLLQLNSFYTITHTHIKGKNGTEFFFSGMRHNTSQIKSMEGVDIVWCEEAHTMSNSSWELLIPTIRKEGSEIWITFNPELQEDPTYDRFVTNRPSNAIVEKINWRDNKWFPDVLKQEMMDLKKRDPSAYEVVWEGHCRQAVDGAIFEDEMRLLAEEGRITSVPYDPKKPVNVFLDLGYGDQTSIWFIQKFGFEYRVIDFYQNARKKLEHYIHIMQGKGYVYGAVYLPHDGNSNHLTGLTVEESFTDLGYKVEIVPRITKKVDSLNAARTVLPVCYFDKIKCADGLQSLRRYRYKVDPETGRVSKEPLHDEYSNGADAFQTFACAGNILWDIVTGQGGGEYKAEYDPFGEDRM